MYCSQHQTVLANLSCPTVIRETSEGFPPLFWFAIQLNGMSIMGYHYTSGFRHVAPSVSKICYDDHIFI